MVSKRSEGHERIWWQKCPTVTKSRKIEGHQDPMSLHIKCPAWSTVYNKKKHNCICVCVHNMTTDLTYNCSKENKMGNRRSLLCWENMMWLGLLMLKLLFFHQKVRSWVFLDCQFSVVSFNIFKKWLQQPNWINSQRYKWVGTSVALATGTIGRFSSRLICSI